MEHFRPVGNVDIAPALDALRLHGGLFAEDTWRQKYPGTAHPDSETIYLRMPAMDLAQPLIVLAGILFDSMEVDDCPASSITEWRDLVRSVSEKVGCRPARAMLIKLNAGGIILPHIDQGAYAEATDRYHLPLITNDAAWLKSGDEKYHLPLGEICWFDKHAMHEGANEGKDDRTHLVVDGFRGHP